MSCRFALPLLLCLLAPVPALPRPNPAARDNRDEKAARAEEYIKVEVRGTLHGGIVAIGGETTGFTITAKGVTWDLDFGKDAGMRQQAEKSDGRLVVVTGTLEVRPGVEVRQRQIVHVTSLKLG